MDTIKLAMISSWHVHAGEYASRLSAIEGCEIVAVWDESPEAGQKWADELHCRLIADYDELCKDPSIDGIVIDAPTNMHADLILRGIQAGKHCYTEKVLTLASKDSYAIAEALKANPEVRFTISFPHRMRADLLFAKEMAESGKLGQVTYVRIRNAHNGSSAGWLPPHFYDPVQCGGGATVDLGAHGIYLLNWILGKPATIQSTFTNVYESPVEDNSVCVLTYENGAIGVAETAFVAQCNPFSLEICGTKGSLRVCDTVTYANEDTEGKWVVAESLPDPLPHPTVQWIESIRTGKKVVSDMEAAVALTEVMEGAYLSHQAKGVHRF